MFRFNRKTATGFLAMLLAISVVSACTAEAKPLIVIVYPPSGSQFREGEEISVQSASSDTKGVVRVELIVDNVIVRADPAPAPQGQPSFNLIQTWQATPGTHTLIVRAFNATGAMSDPVAVSVNVSPQTAPNIPTPIPVSSSSASSAASSASSSASSTAPPASSSSSAVSSSACVNNAAFLVDVTAPDGTNYSAGQAFNKIWRVTNNGTCTWGTTYQFVFVAGEAMATTTVIGVPVTPPGATVDLLIPMTAPAAPGIHAGQWRLRAANGSLFGASLTVKINTLGASSSSSSSAAPPPAGCAGTPGIASFTASANNVAPGTAVTLNWGLVSNAESAEIDQGIGGIETPGSRTVNPATTTTYTLIARCGGNTKTANVTVNVVVLPPPVAVIYDFIAKANAAGDNWQSTGSFGSFNLPFPGSDVDSHGFALWRDNFKLNDGSQPARVLETHPQWSANGTISRCYRDLWNTGYKVQASDHISGKVGFLQGAGSGDVTFRVRLRTDSFPNNDVSVTHLVYADGVKSFSVPLGTINSGQYVGHQADICLIVETGAATGQDWAVWQNVVISR